MGRRCGSHLHEAGGGGLTTIALAGLDLALWDAAARARGDVAVADLLGRRARQRSRAYGSGVNLHYSLDELARAGAAAGSTPGFDAVKIKVGKPDLAEDRRPRRSGAGACSAPTATLMIDANQRWDLDRATRSVDALAAFAPAWIEEPLRADDLSGHAELARRIDVPIAVGENLHTASTASTSILRAGAAQIVQPNIVRVGGITPFRRIAALAAEHGVPLHPHLLPELSGQLALTLAVPGAPPMVEDVEDAGFGALGALDRPAPGARSPTAASPRLPHLGLGIRFADRTRGPTS